MFKWLVTSAFLCVGGVAACGGGGGSGVSGSKKIISISDSERDSVCKYIADVTGPERVITCSADEEVEFGTTVAECVSDLQALKAEKPNCAATVKDFESCMEDLADRTDAQWCSDSAPIPPGCVQLFVCFLS